MPSNRRFPARPTCQSLLSSEKNSLSLRQEPYAVTGPKPNKQTNAHERLLLRELLDPQISGISHVQRAVFVDRDPAGRDKRPRLRRGPRGALTDDDAPGCQRLATRRELLDPPIARVADVHVALPVHRHARRQLEHAGVTAFPAPLRDRLASLR